MLHKIINNTPHEEGAEVKRISSISKVFCKSSSSLLNITNDGHVGLIPFEMTKGPIWPFCFLDMENTDDNVKKK